MKVIELDQRTGEEISVGEFTGEKAGKEAQALLDKLIEQARAQGKAYLTYWIAY